MTTTTVGSDMTVRRAVTALAAAFLLAGCTNATGPEDVPAERAEPLPFRTIVVNVEASGATSNVLFEH